MFELPGAEDIRRWQAEHKKIEDAIRQLHEKRLYLERLIAVARGESLAPSNARRADGRMMPGSWMDEISNIAKENAEGISYSDLKDALPGALAEVLKKNSNHKPFYGALRRLERDEVIVRHMNHVFTPAGYKRYLDKVQAGERHPVRGHDPRYSPMADEVKRFLAENGPSRATAMRDHLAALPQFRLSMRNSSSIYNILKRLVEREELVHDEEASVYALPGHEKAPNGPAAGASQAEEASTSSDDATPLFRVVK